MALQASSGSTRERWVKALLPAAVIIMIYMLFIHLSNSRKLTRLREDFEQSQQSMVTEDQLFALHTQNQEAGKQRDQLADEIEAIRSQIDESLASFSNLPPAQRIVQITDLCNELSIGIIAQSTLPHIKLSREREKAVQEVSKLMPRRPHYQQLDLVGPYTNLVKLMHELPERFDGVVPMGVELLDREEDSDSVVAATNERRWRVYLMM